MAQNIVEQMLVAVRRNAVHLVVRRHHTLYVALFHSGFKWLQKILAHGSLRIVGRRSVGPALWLAVDREVFCRGDNVRAVNERTRTLKALDRRNAEARH